ncbi:MAG: GtrA family protein [Frankiaceae bacterium]
MACSSLTGRPAGAAEVAAELPAEPPHRAAGTTERVVARFRRDDAVAQLVRFMLVGGSSTLLYALLFLALHRFGYLPAHVTATIASSIFANEAHRRLTFRADDRVSFLTAQWEAGGVSLIGLLATTAALDWLDSTTSNAPAVLQIALVIAVTTVIGAMRFVALRWIFRPEPAARPEPALPA